MARIRSIKPEFPQSETVGSLTRDARLLFIQLWTLVDDDGRARAASRMLASLLYPYDDDAPSLIEGWLEELDREGCICRYEVEGSRYLEIAKWLKHQKIDKPSKSKLPAPEDGSRIFAKPREESTPDLGPRTRDLGEGSGPSEATASGAEAPEIPDPKIAERELFTVGKRLLGEGAGGVITSLLKAKGRNVAVARSVIEMASQAQNPMEYVQKAIRNGPAPPANGRTRAGDTYAEIFQDGCDELRSIHRERRNHPSDLEILPPARHHA